MGEPVSEAAYWHQLGRVAEELQQWAEAERCYRASLALKERIGLLSGPNGASTTCNQLARVAQGAGRPNEAEGWWKRALELEEQFHPGGSLYAGYLKNLAGLLTNEVRAGHAPATRLAEARGHAEQALAIEETLDASAKIWITLDILAAIAEMEGRVDASRAYHRREREAFAAFAGNRYHIDQQVGELIKAIAAAAKGNVQAREAVEPGLPQLEAKNSHLASAIRRIWKGELEWHALADGLDGRDALLVLRVLETLGQSAW